MELDRSSRCAMLRAMKRLVIFLLTALLLASLTSCGALSRTLSSVGRTFSNYSGGQVPVIR